MARIGSIPSTKLDLSSIGYVDDQGKPLHFMVRLGLKQRQLDELERLRVQQEAHEAAVVKAVAAGATPPEPSDELRQSKVWLLTQLVVSSNITEDEEGVSIGAPSEPAFWDHIDDVAKACVFAHYQRQQRERIAKVGDLKDFTAPSASR